MPSIIISEDAGKEFRKLQTRSEKGNLESKQLLTLINKGFAELSKNAEAGKQISKKNGQEITYKSIIHPIYGN